MNYFVLYKKIEQIDSDILELSAEIKKDNIEIETTMLAKKQLKGNIQPRIPIQEMSFMLYGTDVSAIKGVSVNTVLTLISEVGQSIKKFKNRKAFVSWLRLAPNNKLSGGKILSSRTPKGNTSLSIAL